MFEGKVYTLAIPAPIEIADTLNTIILNIAREQGWIGQKPKEINKTLSVRPEFHVTLGVFHPTLFQGNRSMFKHLIHFLREHKQSYAQLRDQFRGTCTIDGIGFDGSGFQNSTVVWASVRSAEVDNIRSKIHNLLQLSGIDDSHFRFTNPHMTLFTKAGHGDNHEIEKHARLPLNLYFSQSYLNFRFDTVQFTRGFRASPIVFGRHGIDGRPHHKFVDLLKEELRTEQKTAKKNHMDIGQLFKNKDRLGMDQQEVVKLKELILEASKGSNDPEKDVGKALGKAGYGKKVGTIKGLIFSS